MIKRAENKIKPSISRLAVGRVIGYKRVPWKTIFEVRKGVKYMNAMGSSYRGNTYLKEGIRNLTEYRCCVLVIEGLK